MVAHCADGSPSNTCCSSKKVYLKYGGCQLKKEKKAKVEQGVTTHHTERLSYLLSKVKKADALQLAYAADKVVVAFGP
jgi:hypothetical protein